MPTEHIKLRSPSQLEVMFYHELLDPVHSYLDSNSEDPAHMRAATLLAIRFRNEIARYGYVLTEHGMMVRIEPDILDTELNAAHRAMLALDMQILHRLKYKR